MKNFFARPIQLLLIAAVTFVAATANAENLPAQTPPTNSAASPVSEVATQDLVRAYLQIQEQLHATQLALERNRQDAEEVAGRNALALADRLNRIEVNFSNQRTAEIKTMLLLAGIVAGAVFLAVLLAAYLQTRALRRFAEIAQALPMNQALQLAGVPAAPLLGNGTAEANARLTVTIERLEKRIRELEGGQSTKPALTAGNAAGAAGTSAATGNIEALLAKGQSLLNAGQAAAAVACFDTALALDPQHTEVLVKKGAALEKLAKLDDAIACYDRAIAADGGLTIAYLYKGGVFNRLERYHEALACYEQALKTQERAPAA